MSDVLKTFQAHVASRWTTTGDDLRDLYIATSGLAGETGEVMELLKKNVRDGRLDLNDLKLEMGDQLFYFVRIARTYGLTLEDIMLANIAKLAKRAPITKEVCSPDVGCTYSRAIEQEYPRRCVFCGRPEARAS